MNVDRFYCPYCGLEEYGITVAYSRTCANGDFGFCPNCNKEVSIEEFEGVQND